MIASWKGLSHSSILVDWATLIGSYSALDLKLVLISSDFEDFLTDQAYQAYLSTQTEVRKCQPGFTRNFTLTYEEANANSSFLLKDLCPMSLYNLTFTVRKDDFEPRETFAILQTSKSFVKDGFDDDFSVL